MALVFRWGRTTSLPIPIGNVASLSASDSSTVPARFSLLWNIPTLQLRQAWPSSVLSCRVLTVLVLDGHSQIIAVRSFPPRPVAEKDRGGGTDSAQQTAGYLGFPDLSQDGIMIPGIPSLRHAGLPEGQVGTRESFLLCQCRPCSLSRLSVCPPASCANSVSSAIAWPRSHSCSSWPPSIGPSC